MSKEKKVSQKKNRTLALTIDELLDSVRFEIAVRNFKSDPMFMKAILIELGNEVFNVTKNTVIRKYNTFSGLDQFEMLPVLREVSPSDLTTFNIYFGLTPLEQKLYIADPKMTLDEDERKLLLDKLKQEFMGN